MASHLTPVEEPQSMLALPFVLLPLPESVNVCSAAACKPQAKATACHSATTTTRWQLWLWQLLHPAVALICMSGVSGQRSGAFIKHLKHARASDQANCLPDPINREHCKAVGKLANRQRQKTTQFQIQSTPPSLVPLCATTH